MQKPDLILASLGSDIDAKSTSAFEEVIELASGLTAYQLCRLRGYIDVVLEDPERFRAAARACVPGREIEYFSQRINRCVKGVVSKVNRTTVDVRSLEDGKLWRIDLAAVNTGGAEEHVNSQNGNRQLTKHDLSVGQIVGFQDRDFQDRFGRIIRLNPKTVTLECESGTKWRVAYSILFPVLDAGGPNPSEPGDEPEDDRPRQQLLID